MHQPADSNPMQSILDSEKNLVLSSYIFWKIFCPEKSSTNESSGKTNPSNKNEDDQVIFMKCDHEYGIICPILRLACINVHLLL